MKKLLTLIFCGLLLAGTASASLYQYYADRGQQLPPVSERVIVAETCGILNYSGTYDQNIALEKCLNQGEKLGIALPGISALFESSLQNSVASDATTMTLVSATLKNGNTLSGLYGFIIDEGNSNEEFVICTASSTALSACLRGIDPVDGKTEVASLKSSHRRGASVKITDYPILGIMRRILNGDETTPGGLIFGTNEITGLYQLNGTFDWLRYNTSTSMLQWSPNGTDYYDFTASGITQLVASSTRGIGVTDSKIYLNASSTLGGAFDDNGAYYQKTTTGLSNGSSGIGIDYANNNTWTGSNTFNGTTTLATTTISKLSQTTYTYIINSSTTTSTAPKISADTEQVVQAINAYALVKSISVRNSGSVKVVFDCHGNDTYSAFARIYKNGVALGTERTCPQNTTYAGGTFGENFDFSYGDKIELWWKTQGTTGGYEVRVRNFRLYFTESETTTPAFIVTN